MDEISLSTIQFKMSNHSTKSLDITDTVVGNNNAIESKLFNGYTWQGWLTISICFLGAAANIFHAIVVNPKVNLDNAMKIFYLLDCCCRVVVLAVILPLKLSFITFGLRPLWLLELWGLVEDGKKIQEFPVNRSRDEYSCFLVDNIEFGLNTGVVFFVMLEYALRYYGVIYESFISKKMAIFMSALVVVLTISHVAVFSMRNDNISSLQRTCIDPNAKYDFPKDSFFGISMISIFTYNVISLGLCIHLYVYLLNEEKKSTFRNRQNFGNGKSEGNNSRNIGTAMLGLIHYLIVVLGGVVYCGIGAATEFSNSGQTFTVIWYVIVAHCEHPVHQIWSSTASRSVVYDIFNRAVRICKPKGGQHLPNRVTPIDNWRKSSKENTERSKISAGIPNTVNGEKLRQMMQIGEQSNSMPDNKSQINEIGNMPDSTSSASEHLSVISSNTNDVIISSPTEKPSNPVSLNSSATSNTERSSQFEYHCCKINIHNQPAYKDVNNEIPNDQTLNLDSLINSFCETSIKREQCNSVKTSKRSIMSINRFPNIYHRPAVLSGDDKNKNTSKNPVYLVKEAESSNAIDCSTSVKVDFKILTEQQSSTSSVSFDLKSEGSSSTNKPLDVNNQHDFRKSSNTPLSIKNEIPEFDLNSLIKSFDNSRVLNLNGEAKESIIYVNTFPNIKHQIVASEVILDRENLTTVYSCIKKKNEGVTLPGQKNIHNNEIEITKDLKRTNDSPDYQKDNDTRLRPKQKIIDDKNIRLCKTVPVARKFRDESIFASSLPDVNRPKKFVSFRQKSTLELKIKQDGHDLLAILEENGGFKINRMESSYDPIADCLDVNRCCIDNSREQIQLQNMPLFSVYGMSDIE